MFLTNFKFYYLFAFLAIGMAVVGCDDDDDHDDDHDDNEITINIESPTDGGTVADCAEVHIHVDVIATDENHEFELILHPDGDASNLILDVDMHDHDAVLNFEQDVNLCDFPAGTCFELDVVACVDHDCEETESASVNFCI